MKKMLCILTAAMTMLTISGTGAFAATSAPEAEVDAPAVAAEADYAAGTQAEELPSREEIQQPQQETDVLNESEDMRQVEQAADQTDQAEQEVPEAAATETPAAEETAAPKAQESTGTRAQAEATAPAQQLTLMSSLPKPKKLRAYSGYNQIKLTWKKVSGADYYIIQRSVAGKFKFKQVGVVRGKSFTDKNVPMYTKYAYRVTAAKNVGGKVIKSEPAKIRKLCVSKLRIYVTFKQTKKYSNGTIKKGTRIMTDGFGGGYYLFTYKGKRHSVARIATSGQNAYYLHDRNFSKKEANLFINKYVKANKIRTSKKYLIWVSSYTQHLYVFKKSGGKWKALGRNWEVSMGKASTPSPTGNKEIQKKVSSRHGIPYWNCYSGWNALHGISGGMGSYIGSLASHGCIRNNVSNAGWIYNHCKNGTKVIVF